MPEEVLNYQPPYDAHSLIAHIATATPTAAVIWKLTPHISSPLAGSVHIGATSYDRIIRDVPGHPGVEFLPRLSGQATTVDSEAGHEGAGVQYDTIFEAGAITKETLAAGLWARARVEIYTVNYKALGMGQLPEFIGYLASVEEDGEQWRAEARPLTALAQAQVGRLTGARCSVVRVGDERCKLDMDAPAAGDGGAIKVSGVLTQVVSTTRVRAAALTQGFDYFELIKFTSGVLAGREFEVRTFDDVNKEFVLRDSTIILPSVGDSFTATRRCRRTAEDCTRIYANIINHRGHRFLTNIEQINRIRRAAVR